MSTSLLYIGFRIIGYRFLRTVFKGGSIFFRIEQVIEELKNDFATTAILTKILGQ